jgi:hypothetical protein
LADKVRVRRVRAGDIETIAATMRGADQDEAALYGLTPVDGLRSSVDVSLEAWTVDVDGTPSALFGLAPAGGGKAAPWMLATDALPAAWLGVAKRARRIVQTWARQQPLENWCDNRNAVAVRFLEWLGFTLEPVVGSRVLRRFWMPRYGGG